MKPSLRFLALAVLGWVGVRAATLGALPGAELFRIEPSEAKAPAPIVPTEFPAIEPVEPAAAMQVPPAWAQYAAAAQVPLRVQPLTVPVYYAAASAPVSSPRRLTSILPEPAPAFYSPVPSLDDWPLSRMAAASMPPTRSSVVTAQSVPATFAPPSRLDRVQLSAWALLRGRQGQVLGPTSLASAGQLGGSQAGARLVYNVTPRIAATLRTSSDVGRTGGEAAAGIRVRPVLGLPIWLTAERRQKIGRLGTGRNAFAVFAEGGVYQRPMPWRFSLDAYLQGGVVGVRTRDLFVDGALTLTRPLFRNFSGGAGVWGGAQPGIYRVDAGPRVTMNVRNNLKVHLDYRQRVAGNAQPGSGPAVTLAGDF
ncbi:MAG: hypothetical protein ACJ8D5_07190 [Sphingomicrobium sp.]